jgi:trans-2,3-dihydro-3-hydroxyanthranilate isomerase
MKHRFITADVFTDRLFGGNPLAVLPDARGLSAGQMQWIAREFNLSETAFVLPPDDPAHTRRVRIFTPGAEVAFAGHPTIGTALVLAALGEVDPAGGRARIVLEEGVGPVAVDIQTEEGHPPFAQLSVASLPEFGPPPPSVEAIAAAVSLEPGDLLAGDYAPEAASCGLPFLFVPLRGLDALRRARLNRERWEDSLSSYWAPQPFLFAFDGARGGNRVQARMFAPGLGIAEDPATGSAAAALAGYLGRRDPAREGTLHWTVAQGVEMGRPSRMQVEADLADGRMIAVRVGGSCVLVSEGWLEAG